MHELTGYDPVAASYAEQFFDELARKPFDQELLDSFAARLQGKGPVCDLGCGPGQVAVYLRTRGVEAFGLDASPAMVAEAQRRSPEIPFQQGDMMALDAPDAAWAGIAAFYSIIHVPRDALAATCRELGRVLQPGGLLLLGFHGGEQTIHLDEWWGQPVALDFHFLEPADVAATLEGAGFVVEAQVERAPYAFESPTRRAYILARKPAAG